MDLYGILGITNKASEDEIRKAFRLRAKEAHPDVGGDVELFKKIKYAYDILSDPVAKKNYDDELKSGDNPDFNPTDRSKTEEETKEDEYVPTQEQVSDTTSEEHKHYKKRIYIITCVVLILGILAAVISPFESPLMTISLVTAVYGFVTLLGSISNLIVFFLQKDLIVRKKEIAFLFKWSSSFFIAGIILIWINEM